MFLLITSLPGNLKVQALITMHSSHYNSVFLITGIVHYHCKENMMDGDAEDGGGKQNLPVKQQPQWTIKIVTMSLDQLS